MPLSPDDFDPTPLAKDLKSGKSCASIAICTAMALLTFALVWRAVFPSLFSLVLGLGEDESIEELSGAAAVEKIEGIERGIGLELPADLSAAQWRKGPGGFKGDHTAWGYATMPPQDAEVLLNDLRKVSEQPAPEGWSRAWGESDRQVRVYDHVPDWWTPPPLASRVAFDFTDAWWIAVDVDTGEMWVRYFE